MKMKKVETVALFAMMAVAFPLPSVADDAASSDPAFISGRPGQAEGAVAVAKGYFQVETAIASYTNTSAPPDHSHQYQFAQTSLRYGLFDATDVQVIVTPYTRQTDLGQSTSGFGNTTFRVLHTFMGADGNNPAFAVIGFVTTPTADKKLKNAGVFDNRTVGGAIATGSLSLNDKTSLTLTLAEDTKHPAGQTSYLNDTYGAANLTYAVTDTFGVYAELYGDHTRTLRTQATADFGVTYLLNKTTQLDAEVNLAANKATPDANITFGFAHRF